jgi:hypothetical protein
MTRIKHTPACGVWQEPLKWVGYLRFLCPPEAVFLGVYRSVSAKASIQGSARL